MNITMIVFTNLNMTPPFGVNVIISFQSQGKTVLSQTTGSIREFHGKTGDVATGGAATKGEASATLCSRTRVKAGRCGTCEESASIPMERTNSVALNLVKKARNHDLKWL